jgi:hypothetical protein
MKKVFLMLAFAGLVGSVSASVNNDDKDKGKKECKKGEKSCCKEKAGAEGKACSGDAKSGEKKACCKDKKAAETKAETK